MKILWTPKASRDLKDIVDHIRADSSESATRVAESIYKRIMQLNLLPDISRSGDVPGTRELVLLPWQYIVVFRIQEQAIRIITIRHSRQRWP